MAPDLGDVRAAAAGVDGAELRQRRVGRAVGDSHARELYAQTQRTAFPPLTRLAERLTVVPIPRHRIIRRGLRLLAAWLLICATLASPAAARNDEGEQGGVRLRVMTLNIFYGGDELDLRTGDWCAKRRGCPAAFAKVLETIRASGADVIGLEEAEHSTRGSPAPSAGSPASGCRSSPATG